MGNAYSIELIERVSNVKLAIHDLAEAIYNGKDSRPEFGEMSKVMEDNWAFIEKTLFDDKVEV